MKKISNLNFKTVSFLSGAIMFLTSCGLSILAFAIGKHVKFDDAGYEKMFGFLSYSLMILGIGSIFISILTPRLLYKVLSPITDNLLKTAIEFEKTSKDLSAFSSETSASTQRQLNEINTSASSMQQMQAAVEKNAESTLKSKNLVMRSKKQAHESQGAIHEMVQSIEELNRSQDNIMREISQQNEDLSGIIRIINEINEKTKVINDIVFQTKLLSFNASVEAARAGEHGKGFSVVAQEIGNLAQMSGSASQEISSLLMGSINRVQEIISNTTSRVEELVSQGREKIQKGSEQAKKCEDILTSLTEKVQGVATATEEISVATQEQASGIGVVNSSIRELEKSIQSSFQASQNSNLNVDILLNNSKELRVAAEDLNQIFNFSSDLTKTASTSTSRPKASSRATGNKNAKVIPIKTAKATALKTTEGKAQKKKHAPVSNVAVDSKIESKAMGDNVPHESDPRFEDV